MTKNIERMLWTKEPIFFHFIVCLKFTDKIIFMTGSFLQISFRTFSKTLWRWKQFLLPTLRFLWTSFYYILTYHWIYFQVLFKKWDNISRVIKLQVNKLKGVKFYEPNSLSILIIIATCSKINSIVCGNA